MNLNGMFYSVKSHEYNKEIKQCIENTILKLDEIGQNPLMMLGKIQSGKTRAFIGVISLAFDNGYDLAIVMTKNSNALAKQTAARMKSEFVEFIDNDELDVYDIMQVPDKLSRYELNKKIIIIVKKQHANLPKLLDFIKTYAVADYKKCMIIDDEADFTSVGFEKDKDSQAFDLRVIASQINRLRVNLEAKFIQVTATPYSLYLQPNDVVIRGETIEKIKPMHTILVPHGKDYIGGDYYFDENVNPNKDKLYFRIYESELAILKKSDRRKLKEEFALRSDKIDGLKMAILNFMVGGCTRIIQNGGSPKRNDNKYSFIIHTETAKSSHQRQLDLIDELISQIEKEMHQDTDFIKKLFMEAYNEIKSSLSCNGILMPEPQEVYSCFRKAIDEEWVSRVVVNSVTDVETLLDEEGQLKRRTPLTIFVGGQILDRGITIANLIGFYYGRRPQKTQQDTVLQHSRMFGYRKKEDLVVTKFYTTIDLYERMALINEFDKNLRNDIESDGAEQGIYFISKDSKGRIIPCSPNKIALTKIKVIRPGVHILPVGFKTKSNTAIKGMVKQIDSILLQRNQTLKGEFILPKADAQKIIELAYKCIEIENDCC